MQFKSFWLAGFILVLYNPSNYSYFLAPTKNFTKLLILKFLWYVIFFGKNKICSDRAAPLLIVRKYNNTCKKIWFWNRTILSCNANPFHAKYFYLYPLKSYENQRFFGIFRGYKKRPVICYGFISLKKTPLKLSSLKWQFLFFYNEQDCRALQVLSAIEFSLNTLPR